MLKSSQSRGPYNTSFSTHPQNIFLTLPVGYFIINIITEHCLSTVSLINIKITVSCLPLTVTIV